jgi:hypothetical protein
VTVLSIGFSGPALRAAQPYTVVDTGQAKCYDNRNEISPPKPGQPFYGQEAQHQGVPPAYQDNGDGTVTDRATGLMWSKDDNQKGLNWEQALAWAQAKNQENYLGHKDWRLPNVREMQSLVDYARIPEAANSTNVTTAIHPLFHCTPIIDQEGNTDCPYYWTSTSCYHGPDSPDYRFA